MTRFRILLSVGWLASTATAAVAQYPYPQSPYPRPAYPQQSYPQPSYPQPQYPQPPYPQQQYPQQPYQSYQPTAPLTDADQLAQQMRSLAADPNNLYALINAGNLSLKVGDTDGAAALFTRAEKVSPGNPQLAAGKARLLVNAQRPGEALRLFQEAQSGGASERDFGSDRALAYDLIGDQPRAQREYRAILRRSADDEAIRRYAMSLGISGLKDPALALLEPLNRRGDRGSWRTRAFVLAMNGDRPGAERIAITMMPPGMAEGLRPFFDRLPRLAGADRAFAVHFGEVRPSATRIADARRVPFLPALAPEPNPFPSAYAGTRVAAVDTGKKSKRDRRREASLARAVRIPYVAPLPPPPAPTASQLAALASNRLAPPPAAYGVPFNRGVTVLPPPADAYRAPVTQLAQAVPPPSSRLFTPAPAAKPDDESGDEGPDEPVANPVTLPTRQAQPLASVPIQPSAAVGTGAPRVAAPVMLAPVPVAPILSAPPSTVATPPVVAATATFAQPPTVAQPATQGGVPIGSLPPAVQSVANPSDGPPVQPVADPTAPAPAAALTPPPPVGTGGDTVLAAIVANIQVPQTELVGPKPVSAQLLTTIEKRAEPRSKPGTVGSGVKLDPARLRKDGRGRFIDSEGRPLLDTKGQPMDAKGAIAWLTIRDPDYTMMPATDAVATLPKKDARGRFVDAKGKPLLDPRGRPMDATQAAAWAATPDKAADGAPAKGKADALPKKDARGRFADAKGKPLLDARGRPMDAKQATAWLAAGGKSQAEAKAAPEKAEPQRIWVQVAGGANEDTLPKEWARAQAQAAGLKGRQGWTTPLRATNRVLTGPFKSSDEAMTLVNLLKKQGVAAFMFTSDPGQKVTRLPAK